MSSLKINLAEKRLLSHLQLGGTVDDAVGRQLVVKFAQTAYADGDIAAIAARHHISTNDICIIYASMVQELMPNPCIEAGGLMLVPTLFFMEPFRFEGLASEIATRAAGLSDEDRRVKIRELAVEAGSQTWHTHTSARGEANFVRRDLGGRKSSGCAGVLIFGFVLVFCGGYLGAMILN